MTTWRRKRDGRPYADVKIAGKRRRISLLKSGEGAFDVPDEVLAKRADQALAIWTRHAAQPAAPPDTDTLKGLRHWYLTGPFRARNPAPRTVQLVEFRLDHFEQWAKANDIVTVDQLRAKRGWPASYVGETLATRAPATTKAHLAHVRAMFRAAYDAELLDEPIVRRWPTVKVPERVPKAFTAGEVKAILEFAHARCKHARAIEFMARLGCRPSDAAALTWANVDFVAGQVAFIQRKTGDAVRVPMTAALRQLLLEQRAATRGTGSVFETTVECLVASTRYCCREAVGHGSPKLFRAAVVSRLMESGADREDIGRITGHRSDAIAAYYARSERRSLELLAAIERMVEGGDE